MPERTNRLADETSPYLRQHAHNPGGLVSVERGGTGAGSAGGQADPAVHRLFGLPLVPRHGPRIFRGPATAAVMNELFVSIKVDREERPDLDKIYQTAHQMLTQRGGGWPLDRCS